MLEGLVRGEALLWIDLEDGAEEVEEGLARGSRAGSSVAFAHLLGDVVLDGLLQRVCDVAVLARHLCLAGDLREGEEGRRRKGDAGDKRKGEPLRSPGTT